LRGRLALGAAAVEQVAHHHEEHRHQEDGEDRRGKHAAHHRPADRMAAGARAGGNGQRQHAEDEGKAGHQDRAQPQLGGFDRGVEGAHALAHPLLGELDDQDRVLRRQADRW
jgi:hypothetical protein